MANNSVVLVSDINRTTPPGSPAQGDSHFVAAGASGGWSGKSSTIAVRLGSGWIHRAPKKGDIITDDSTGLRYRWDGSALTDMRGERPFSIPATFWPRAGSSSAGSLGDRAASTTDPTDLDGFFGGVDCANDAHTAIGFEFLVPTELDLTQPVTLTVAFRLAAAGTGTKVEIQFTARIVADNEAITTGGDLILLSGGSRVKDVHTYASADLVVFNVGEVIAANTLNAGDFVKGCIMRDAQVANNANDTFANTVRVSNIQFIGTRKF